MAAAYLEFDLVRELEQLHHEPGWSSGQNAKTLAKYDDLRIVLIALKPHARLPEHQTEGRVAIQTVAGHIQGASAGSNVRPPDGPSTHIGSGAAARRQGP